MASTSSSASAVYYPCPSEVNVANFVPLKLGPSNYSVWNQLMLNLIESHELEGFIDGTIQPPPFPLEEQKQEEYRSWKRSDGLVRGWVFVTVTEEILPQLVHLATAREAWIALKELLSPPTPSPPQSIGESEPGAAPGFPTETNPTTQIIYGISTEQDSVVKLCRTNYSEWRQQMLDLFESRQLVGFVDGTILPPEKEQNKEDYLSWKKSDGEVRRLIFDMVTEEILEPLAQVQRLETARDAWIAVEEMLSPSAPSLPESISEPGAAPEFPTETNPTTQIIYGNSTEQDSAVKLCRTNYSEWRQQMLDLLESWQLVGYVDGTIQPPEEAQNQEEYWSWKTSDGQVRELIFNMVTVEILEPLAKVTLATAREAWIALEEMLSPSAPSLPQSIHGPEIEHKKLEDKKATVIAKRYSPLYRATLNGDWENATKFFEQEPNAVRDAITVFSETALMLAVRSSKRNHFVKKLMERISPEDVVRSDYVGKTALHHATEYHNNVAAKLLVEKNPELLYILDQPGETARELAVHYAALRGNRELVDYLVEVTKLDGDPNPFEGNLGVGLLTNLICGELYDIASTFLQRYPKLASMNPSPLMELSYRRTSFCSGTRLNFFQRLIYSGIPLKLEGNANKPVGRDVENSAEGVVSPLVSQKLHAMFWDVAEKLVPITIMSVRETKLKHHQALNFLKHICEEVMKLELLQAGFTFKGPLQNATTLGTCEIMEEILELYPSGIHFTNQTRQTLFHLAIEHRQQNVFSLMYQMNEKQEQILLLRDKFGNNALHTAGFLASRQQLMLQASVAGAVLQIQRELQWFKAVEKLIQPQYRYVRNNEGKTPQDVFTETHKDLVEKGEKWMKDTASSCSIVAALIVTIVFAAAITVPGGNNGNGFPIFLEDGVFFLFGMFDALALFSSTASLLMFLSIFTSRYGEHDFLYSLPMKLIIGLVTLFLSIISMMIAFGATIKIVFGYKKTWVVIPVVVLSSAPITLFALLQFPLLLDIIRSTYYSDIFRKRSNRILL